MTQRVTFDNDAKRRRIARQGWCHPCGQLSRKLAPSGYWIGWRSGEVQPVVKRSQWWAANFFTPPELAGAVTRELRRSGATRPELFVSLEMP
jgi:hypothetical protein